MPALILDGRAAAKAVRSEVRARVRVLNERGVEPGLGIVLAGDYPPSQVYVASKEKAGAKKGEDKKKAGGDMFLAFEKAWMAAVNEYCAARKAATDKAGIDMQPILDAKAKEAGFKDWVDYATKVATASADRYKRIVERMSKYISLRMAELEKKESEKPKDGGDKK